MQRQPRSRLTSLLLLTVLTLSPAALAADEWNVAGGMTAAGAPLAIHGYDPVAFFAEGAAMVGSANHTAVHDGAAYRFVSETNKKQFERNPGQYLPQFGGYCAYGVSVGKKFDGDPRLFEVVDDKLYFNLNPEIKATWVKDISGNVAKAEKSWAKIRTTRADKL